MDYYELWGTDAKGDQGYSRFDNKDFFDAALKEHQEDPFIVVYKWRLVSIIDEGPHYK